MGTEVSKSLDRAVDIVKIIGGVKVVIYIGSLGGTSISRLMVYNVPCANICLFFFCDNKAVINQVIQCADSLHTICTKGQLFSE